MSDLKRYTPQVSPEAGGPSLPSGGMLTAPQEAIANLGQTIANIGGQLQNELDVDATNQAKIQMEQIHNTLYLKYKDDPDYHTSVNRYAEELDQQKAAIIDKPYITNQAKKYIESVYNENKIRGLFQMEEIAKGKRRDNMMANYIQSQADLSQAVADGRLDAPAAIEKYEGIARDMLATGMVDESKIKKDLIETKEQFTQLSMRQKVWNEALKLGNGAPSEAGLKMLNDITYYPQLDRATREELQGNMSFLMTQNRNLEDLKEKQAQETSRGEIVKQLTAGTLTPDMVMASNLDAKEKSEWIEKANTRNHEQLIKSKFEKARAMPNPEDGIKYLQNSTDLDPSERKSLSETLKAFTKPSEDELVNQIFEKVRAMPTLEEGVKYLQDSTALKPSERESLINTLKFFKEPPKSKFEESDLQVKARVFIATTADTPKITRGELDRLVGNGLSIADAEHYKGMLDSREKKDDILNRPDIKQYFDAMKDIFEKGMFAGAEIKTLPLGYQIKNQLIAVNRANEFTKWLQAKKDPADAEVKAKFQELVTPMLTYSWFSGDITDAETGLDIAEKIDSMPPSAKIEWQKARTTGTSATDFINKWQKQKKTLDKDTAKHYLLQAGGDRKKAIELAKKDGYSE